MLPHGGAKRSFQMPCKFAGLVLGRELDINKYLPYCKYNPTKEGSLDDANFSIRSSVGKTPSKSPLRKSPESFGPVEEAISAHGQMNKHSFVVQRSSHSRRHCEAYGVGLCVGMGCGNLHGLCYCSRRWPRRKPTQRPTRCSSP